MFVLKQSAVIVLIALLGGCISTTQMGSLAAERKQFIALPEKIWHQQANYNYQKFLKKIQKNQLLVLDPTLEKVLLQLQPHTASYRTDIAHWSWEIKAMLNGELNAYGFPGGKIIINTGIAWNLKLTTDELAFVIAHEMAHALREHNRERMSSGLLLGMPSLVTEGISQTWVLESEADLIALDLLQRAGFQPQAGISFWQKFQQESIRREQYQAKSVMSSSFFNYRIQKIQNHLAQHSVQQDDVLKLHVSK